MQGPSRKAGWISPVSDEANFLGHYVGPIVDVGPIVADVISCFDDEDPMCGFVARATALRRLIISTSPFLSLNAASDHDRRPGTAVFDLSDPLRP
jgi:hypothetical protein